MAISASESLQGVLADVSKEITEHLSIIGLGPEAVDRIYQCFVLTTKGGNLLRGRTVLDTGFILNGHDLSPVQSEELAVLGCLIEFFNAAYVIWDDIMDGSSTRRGQPCWYRRDNVGMIAINDACILKSAIYFTLKKRFRDHPRYLDLHELFDEAALRTELGQHCDLMATAKLLKPGRFTWDQYEFIAAQKTAFYTFYLPIAIPLVYLKLTTAKMLDDVHRASTLLGLVFQARDDFLDVYGDPSVTGKIGTDIQENKCSWLSVYALENCNNDQKEVFRKCYGSSNDGDISKVMKLFRDLNVSEAFHDWNKAMSAKIDAMVEEMTDVALKEVLIAFLSKYNRDPRRTLVP
ncbi:hypothetical protein N7468_001451 [Penicillium chermesinum]|uniref:Uncharacterized protein n=1 Tax=Penicillium chermesinum TaxID=63820 RepID=A0A9W9PGM0_9EURO|nr:uncharacterized protein N7468_001451 [Penicillium chermesinum]KAJ5246468.1 hypothetical protein N7468_001451 [Penicillium chermesinum]KAJ6144741.1 hypothetical protein N7470_008636 [Penicillium chermesinum]